MRMRQAVVVAGLALGLMSGAAKANTIDSFSVSGTFDDSRILLGTIDIDVTAGKVVLTSLATSRPDNPVLTNIFFTNTYASRAFGGGYLLQNSSPASFGNVPRLNLLLAATTLVGYDGGAIYSEMVPSPRNSYSALVLESGVVGLNSGALRFLSSYSDGPVSTVPLPASAPLFGAALMALSAVGYGLKRKSKAAVAA